VSALAGVDVRGMLLAEDVAIILRVSPVTVREWARRGRLPCLRLPGTRRVLFPRAWIEAYVGGDTELVVDLRQDGGRLIRPSSCVPLKSNPRRRP
jgi:excisionase family DNA binding protein